MPHRNIHLQIVKILRSAGTAKCIERADTIEADPRLIHILNLRDLDLTHDSIGAIICCLSGKDNNNNSLKSISFSYNILMGDKGIQNLLENIPKSIIEIGLVDCGISDIGGEAILKWLQKTPELTMICVEQNNFSDKLKSRFKEYDINSPQTVIFY